MTNSLATAAAFVGALALVGSLSSPVPAPPETRSLYLTNWGLDMVGEVLPKKSNVVRFRDHLYRIDGEMPDPSRPTAVLKADDSGVHRDIDENTHLKLSGGGPQVQIPEEIWHRHPGLAPEFERNGTIVFVRWVPL